MVIHFTSDDLEAIRTIIKEEITAHFKKLDDTLYTREELCLKLGMDKSTYHKHINQGKLKVKKFGRKLQIVSVAH